MLCDIKKCKSACCYNVPHTMYTLNTNKKKIITPWKYLADQGLKDEDGRKLFVPIVDDEINKNKCPFLRDDFKCNIYDKRPFVCRAFGTPPKDNKSKFLRCGYLEGKEQEVLLNNEEDVYEGIYDLLNSYVKRDKR